MGRFDSEQLLGLPDEGHDHATETFDRWSYRTDEPFSQAELRRMIKRDLPASVYRCKGIVYTVEQPGQQFALQVVGRRIDLTPLEHNRTDDAKTSEIVAIGRGVDPVELDLLFATCHGIG